MTRVTVVVENRASTRNVLSEHGLSLWIEHEGRHVLFDTGGGRTLAPNVRSLRIPLEKADAIVLSHGHYDHTGGLLEALKLIGHETPVYVHPKALESKFSKTTGTPRRINVPEVNRDCIEAYHGRVHFTEAPTEIVPGLFATGPVPRVTDYEKPPRTFFLDEACTIPDPVEDDQSIYFYTGDRLIVLCGCAHAGVVNTLRYVASLTGDRPQAVLGGMHLLNSGPDIIDRTISELRELGVTLFAPSHCTGIPMTAALWDRFPNQCRDFGCGQVVEFDAAAK